MNVRAGLAEYILQTYNTNFLKIHWGGGFEPSNPPLGTPVGVATRTSCFPVNFRRHFIMCN